MASKFSFIWATIAAALLILQAVLHAEAGAAMIPPWIIRPGGSQRNHTDAVAPVILMPAANRTTGFEAGEIDRRVEGTDL